jgi:hypothetical protein
LIIKEITGSPHMAARSTDTFFVLVSGQINKETPHGFFVFYGNQFEPIVIREAG